MNAMKTRRTALPPSKDTSTCFEEMEHFWRGYSDEQKKRIEQFTSYQEAMRNRDAIKAQEIAVSVLEDFE